MPNYFRSTLLQAAMNLSVQGFLFETNTLTTNIPEELFVCVDCFLLL